MRVRNFLEVTAGFRTITQTASGLVYHFKRLTCTSNTKGTPFGVPFVLEVTAGFEPADNGVADRGLTTWLRHQKVGADYGARDSQSYLRAFRSPSKNWSGLRGSNPPPRPWQGRALPNELNPRKKWCLRSESNQRHGDFQSPALPTELQRQISPKQDWRPEWGSNPRPLA